MEADLTEIKGIGKTAAASLSEAGFTTIEKVANATQEALGKVNGFGEARAARVIAAARELAPGVTSEKENVEVKDKAQAKPEVDLDRLAYSKRTDAAKTKRSFFASPMVLILFPISIFLLLLSVIYNTPGLRNYFSEPVKTSATTGSTEQESTREVASSESEDSVPEEGLTEASNTAVTDTDESPESTGNQQEIPQWFVDQYRAGIRPPVEPLWVTKQRAAAKRYHAEMQQRFAKGLPPIEPPWVIKQRVEAQKRYEAAIKRRNAYLASRGYPVPPHRGYYGTPPRP